MTMVGLRIGETRREVRDLEARGDVLALAAIVRECAAITPRVFTLPEVKAWCRRRWRFLFLREAVEDQLALEAASVRGDTRPLAQRIAERYLARDQQLWDDDQPQPAEGLVSKTALLLCPGLINGLLPEREFRDDLARVAWRYRMRAMRSDSHPARGCLANTQDIVAAFREGRGRDERAALIEDAGRRPIDEAMVIAYSKGAPDVLTTLVTHPEIARRVRCLVTWAGAIGGSQIADSVAQHVAPLNAVARSRVMTKVVRGPTKRLFRRSGFAKYRVDEYDATAALTDLTTEVRSGFLARHGGAIDQLSIPIFTFRGVTSRQDAPITQRGGCAILEAHEVEHDMQVAGSCSQLQLPMATELAVFRGHHWDIAYPSFGKRRWLNKTFHPFPKTAALLATVQLARELGLVR